MFTRSIRGLFGGVWRREEGVAALELGLVSPFLVLLMVGVIELGTASYEAMQVQNAAEAGAIYASKNGYDAAGISEAIANSGGGQIDASPAPSQYCACPADDGFDAVECTDTCDNGATPGQYVQINTRFTHTPLISFPGFTVPGTLTGVSVVRVN